MVYLHTKVLFLTISEISFQDAMEAAERGSQISTWMDSEDAAKALNEIHHRLAISQ